MATLVICVLQGVVGAYAQSSGKGSTRRQLDVIQAGFAGAVGALLIQLALGFIDGFVVERDKKASPRLTVIKRGKGSPASKAQACYRGL